MSSSKQIGTFVPPPSTGQIAATLAGNSAQNNKFSLVGGPQGYAGIGIPVVNTPSFSAGVGAFSTFGKGMPRSTGAGVGLRFKF